MRFIFALLLTLSLVITPSVFADDLILTNIGGLATQGKKFNQWWYEPQRVVLKGVGSKAANIDITIDGKFNTIHSSTTDGTWSYDLGNLSVADHSIILGSGTESYSFVLTIGSTAPADMNTTKGGLPTAGGLLPLIGLASLAGVLIYVGFRKSES
ncbi:MAG: hypothetical protein NTV98_01795 [Candidatus Roizmanbacteria bacterium]|nr:hypothetical protein [Candidatus Roizmanbacteria bacterium]